MYHKTGIFTSTFTIKINDSWIHVRCKYISHMDSHMKGRFLKPPVPRTRFQVTTRQLKGFKAASPSGPTEILSLQTWFFKPRGKSDWLNEKKHTLPETNSSHLKMGHPKRKLVFQPSIFRCYVSFKEGIILLMTWNPEQPPGMYETRRK